MDSSTTEQDCTMEIVMKNIYASCDSENANMVPVSKLIEFITPYMLEDLSALESLRHSLDPENNNVCVSSEKFYEVMNEWTKKITNSSDEESDFNRTPNALEVIDEKKLPYIQSTPRASFGQRLLSCEALLNLSNVSSYSLSTSTQTRDNSTGGQEKTLLEEEVKRLELHLNKVSNELMLVKLQLTAAEEQNEILQADLDRCKTRLQSEQQIVEHLQNDNRYNDELREELNSTKKQIEELNKRLLLYEKDNHHLHNDIKRSEKENAKLEERCDELSRREHEAKKQIIDIKTELDIKDQEIITIIKINDELRSKLNEQKDIIDELTNENELLKHQKNNLEKTLRDNLSARRESLVHQYKTCLADSSSLPNIDQGSEDECYFKIQGPDYKNSIQDSLHAEISQVVQAASYSSLLFENNETSIEFEEESGNVNCMIDIYKEEINQLKIKNDSIRARLETVNQDNNKFREEIAELKDKMCVLQQDLNKLMIEKKDKETELEQIKEEKEKLEKELQQLHLTISELTDQNNNLSEKEKSINATLEVKSKAMTELEQNLLELKREFTSLQIDNIAKEKELSTKFNFEMAYKELQMELNEKNEKVEILTKSNEELKIFSTKLNTLNQELELSLKRALADLKDNEDKSKKMMSLNENITLTTAQVQVHLNRKNDMINELVELNKRFENNMTKLEEQLQNKIAEVIKLRDNLEADIKIKNIMWRDNKELKLQLDFEIEKKEKLFDEIKEIREKHQKEYNELLTNYNEEVEKNCKLCDQISTFKIDLSSSIKKYNEEVNNNSRLHEQVSALKKDIDTIRENQEENKAKINKKLTDYENMINLSEKKLQEMESENDKLKTALAAQEKKKPSAPFDFDISSSESKNSRNFEKQKLAIDRLKEKLENMQEQLQREKTRREILEQLMKEKDDVEDKYTRSVLDLEQAQGSILLEKQELQNTVIDLSSKVELHESRSTDLENKLRETEETLSLKLSQVEQQNQHMYTELRNNEFIIKNAYLEIETYKNLFKTADQKAQELAKTISVYLFESNSRQKEIQLLRSEVTDRDNKILSLSSKIAEQDVEMSSILNELTEKKSINVTLEKENQLLQEMLSKSDDHKEKELMDIEEKLKNTRRLLQCTEMELNLVEKKLSSSTESYEKMSDEVTRYGSIVTNGKTELTRASNLVFNKWGEILERETVYKELISLKDSEPSKRGEICSLDNKIKIAVLLLELLASKSPVSMEGTDYGINSLLNTKSNTNQFSQSDVKMIKKFTLRPSRLHISRPVSPDSPSLNIEGSNLETSQEINYNTSKEIFISPDNHICHTCPYSSDDSYETAGDDLSYAKDNTIEFTSFQDTFPNISDMFLEKLGLNEDSLKKNLTKEETEEIFATFAIQIALDSRDVKERLQKQKDRCVQQHEKFLSLVRDISNRLRDHKCIGAADPISPVFVLLEDVKFLLRDLTQSTQQFGILTCENRMMKCWNLVTNYTALLKQDVVNLRAAKPIEKSDDQGGAIANFGAKFRKRLQNLNSKDETNCSPSVSSSENGVTEKNRFKCATVKSSFALIVSAVLFIFILFIFIHWQCRMTAHENQVCVLDDFIKKIQIGNPPY